MKVSKKTLIFTIFVILSFFPIYDAMTRLYKGAEILTNSQQVNQDISIELYDHKLIEQHFFSSEEGLSSIEIQVGTFNRQNTGELNVELKDLEDNVLSSKVIRTEGVKDNEYLKICFDPVQDSKGKEYKLAFFSPNNKENSIVLHSSKGDEYLEGDYYEEGQEVDKDIVFKTMSKAKYPRIYFVGIFILVLVTLGIYFLIYKYKLKLHKVFLIYGTIYGLIMIFALPPYQAPDEKLHFFRAYEISKGSMISKTHKTGEIGNYLPEDIEGTLILMKGTEVAFYSNNKINYTDFKKALFLKDSKNQQFYVFPNAAIYAPLQYIPQSFGILVSRILRIPVLWSLYFGRIFNLISWITITYFAIKLMPKGKIILLSLSLLPMSIQQAASLSPDALLNSISYLFIALCFYLAKEEVNLRTRHIVALISLFIFISISKIVYLPLALMMLVMPVSKFKNKNSYIGTFIGLTTGGVLITTLWMRMVNSRLTLDFAGGDVNTKRQIVGVLKSPFVYLNTIRNTMVGNIYFYVESMIGKLGWLDTKLPDTLILMYILLGFLIVLVISKYFTKRERILAFSTFILGVILILSSLYAIWTPVGAPVIGGVQGRYLLPLAPLAFMSIPRLDIRINMDKFNELISIFLNYGLLYSMVVLIMRYYI